MKKLVLFGLIVLLILAFVPDTWLGKIAGVGGPKVAGTILKVSGWVKKLKVRLVGLVKRQPKLVDPRTGKPLPAPLPIAPKEGEVTARAMEPSGGGGIPGGETPGGWKNILKKVLPYALPVLVALIVIVGIGFFRSRTPAGSGGGIPEVSGMFESGEPELMPPPEPSFLRPNTPAAIPPYAVSNAAPTLVAPSQLGDLAKEWTGKLLFAWAFAVLCLVVSKLPIVPSGWQQTAGFLVSFSLLGVTPFVVLMFAGEVLSSTLAPLATGAGRIFGDAGRSVVVLINYTVPLVAVVTILLLLVAKTGGNIVNFAAGTSAPAVSKLATALNIVIAGDPFNIAIIALSLVGYILVVMRKVF